ncbi:RNA polymerase sigma factor SigM [Tsukamurella soli]|uniref:RNA polymerase sigma factor SigM n=1 Tax=Tsukamurella soli TaxID=644556 RepID=A0ABP8J2W1_9ACTN
MAVSGARGTAEYEELSDEELIAAAGGGDQQAFGELYNRHHRHLWATAVRTARTLDDAEDCLQEAFERAYQLCREFRGDCRVASWLHRIVINACVDTARRNRIRLSFPMPEDPSGLASDDGVGVDRLDTRIAVYTALRKLPRQQVEAIIAVDVYGLSITEAAEALGVQPGTVKSRRARARDRLSRLLR